MSEVGIRELNQQTGRVLRRVAAGESLVVTDHGRPVAMLVPLPKSTLQRLTESGQVTAGGETLATVNRRRLSRPSADLLDELGSERL